jgi:hypothetical protein
MAKLLKAGKDSGPAKENLKKKFTEENKRENC